MPQLYWTKYPRKLGKDFSEFFYSGNFEDEKRIVKVTIRPSLWMSVSESFKNLKPNGKTPEDGYTGTLVNCGTSVEVQVDENFRKNIEAISKPPKEKLIQKVFW